MINPGGIPRIPGDMEALARHAEEISRVGPEFSGTGQQVNSTWQQLAGVYDAPEAAQLLGATGPVQTTSASVGQDLTTVGAALGTYASTVKQIQTQLDALRAQAEDLVAEAKADKASEGIGEKIGEKIGYLGDDDEYAERGNELAEQVHVQVAAFAEAQRVCANTINALYDGGIQYRADDGDGQQEPGEYGFTAQQLDTAFEQGQELPWGTYAETDTGIVGGIKDAAKNLVVDLGALIGRDPTTGDWSWATAGTAWKGMGTFFAAAGVYAMPGGAIIDQQFNDGKLGDTLLNAGKGIIAYDEWGKGDNARAGAMAGFNIVSSIVGTKGAGATLRGTGAAAQTSRIGAISRAGTAMVRSGELIGRLPTTKSLIDQLSNLRVSANNPDANTSHRTDTPTPDPPRADTPHPGSVADDLADTGRTPEADSAPSIPDAPSGPDVPGSRGTDSPPVGGAVPDAPSTPDAPTTSDAPRTPDTPAAPGDLTPGTGTPGKTTPGDGTPGDRTPQPDTDTSTTPLSDTDTDTPTSPQPDTDTSTTSLSDTDMPDQHSHTDVDSRPLDPGGHANDAYTGVEQRAWPTDPSTGSPLTDHDLEFLGLTRKQIEWWMNGEAPLGMTPQTYREWTTSMHGSLRGDGISAETVDVRLLGSAARGFSGPHKQIPTEQEITIEFDQDVAGTAIERRRDWLGDDPERLKGRPFDSMNKLGLDEPSDYDLNISSDDMVEKARAWWEANGRPGDFLSGDHEYVNKRVAEKVFPNLSDWSDAWTKRLGRDVSVAVFPSSGPKDVSASGHFVHFQDDDWIVHRPEGS